MRCCCVVCRYSDPFHNAIVYVDRKETHRVGFRDVPSMWKERSDGKYEPIKAKLSDREYYESELGGVVDDIGYDAGEDFKVTVRTCRMLVVSVTYMLPQEKERRSAIEHVLHSTLQSSDFQEINEHARRNSFGSTNSAVENKFAESTQTLTYEERRAYTRGIDELVDHLKHSLRDEWEARDLEWTHWNGDAKTAKSEWQYVNGPAVSSDKVLRRSLSDVAEGEGDAPKAIRGRDDNNHGVTVEGFQRRINSFIQKRADTVQRRQPERFKPKQSGGDRFFEGSAPSSKALPATKSVAIAALAVSNGNRSTSSSDLKTEGLNTDSDESMTHASVDGSLQSASLFHRISNLTRSLFKREAHPVQNRPSHAGRSASTPSLLQGLQQVGTGVTGNVGDGLQIALGGGVTLGSEHLLTRDEVLAVRLYTGPGYAPINGWLREVGNLPNPPAEGLKRWGAWTPERGAMSAADARKSAALDRQTSFGATVGHLTAAIRKIAAASTPDESSRKLYRGLKGQLDARFWIPDEFGIVCATDTAFMSTTVDEKVSLFYVTKKDAGQQGSLGLLWELHASEEDDTGLHVGADVSMLSQFAHEQEILFPPLTMLRVLPRKPPPKETELPCLPSEGLEGLESGSEEERRRLTVKYAKVLVDRSMQMMQRQEEQDERKGVPYVRVGVQPVYTGL